MPKCGQCGCPACGCTRCDCVLRTADGAAIQGIWFGNRSKTSKMPSVIGLLCCGICVNNIFIKKVAIPAGAVSLYNVDAATVATVASSASMQR